MKVFCTYCGKEVNFHVVEKKFNIMLEKEEIQFIGKLALCDECHETLLVDEVEDYNQQMFEEAFKRQNDIISKTDIDWIIETYQIGKRPLSIVLDLGELTITRYLDGYIPSKKNSDFLKKIKNHPEEYYSYLHKNKDKISPVAFKKSKNAVDKLLNINDNDTLIEDVAEYIIKNNPETTPLVLQKLLYYVELLYGMIYEKLLFESECSAWEHGPVYGRIYYLFKDFGQNSIELEEYNSKLNSSMKEIIDVVIQSFGCYSGNVLSFFTHKEKPWKYARENNLSNIDKKQILTFALELKEQYKIKKAEDIRFYSNAMFKKYQKFVFSKPEFQVEVGNIRKESINRSQK